MSSAAAAPTRLMNKQVNPYWGMLKKNDPQAAVYIHGQELPQGLEGGVPAWVLVEFPAVAPFDTQDAVMNLPDNFTLLTFLSFDTQATAGCAVQLYDLNREMWLMDKSIDKRIIMGRLGNVLFQHEPYDLAPTNAQIYVRVINQSVNQNDIQVCLYGVVGGIKT